MMDSEKVMELAQAVSDANARLDAADDMQKQAYQDSCLAEEALLDYLGSVVTKVARDAEDDFDSAENMLDASAPAEEIETDGSAHVTIDPVTVIDATGDTGVVVEALGGEDADADPDLPVIGSFSEVSDEDVRAAGGEPVSRVDALNTVSQIVPDFGPVES